MKRIIAIILCLVLCMMAGAFAFAEPPESAPDKWSQYADQLERSGRYEEAAAAYKKAGSLFAAYTEEWMLHEGFVSYRNAARLYQSEGMTGDAIECYIAGGDVAMVCGEYSEAEALYYNAGQLAEDIQDTKTLAIAREKLGDSYFERERFSDAISPYSLALLYYEPEDEAYPRIALKYAQTEEKIGENEERIAHAYRDASGAFYYHGDIEKSIELMKTEVDHFLKAAKQAEDDRDKADFERNASNAFAAKIFELNIDNHLREAAELCFECYDYFGPSEHTAMLIGNIALPYYESNGDNLGLAYSSEIAGDCYRAAGDRNRARACYQDASEYYHKAGCANDAMRMDEMAGKCSTLGSIFSNGSVVIIIVIAAVVLVLTVVLIKKKKK